MPPKNSNTDAAAPQLDLGTARKFLSAVQPKPDQKSGEPKKNQEKPAPWSHPARERTPHGGFRWDLT
ncbi:MAG: hypothetical protein H6865_03175 [Rhodospirillales bacterium]|nr:hypothetical protein [Alphaproteobacteria bacterium]MCB9986620.1 hypothetical protein [Rhodospirillales bacterium]USO06850.1 MAG: hypothetical protein H6866_05210 [Rhodospirillales bacterium]